MIYDFFETFFILHYSHKIIFTKKTNNIIDVLSKKQPYLLFLFKNNFKIQLIKTNMQNNLIQNSTTL